MRTSWTERLALDVGGANIKLAHTAGIVRSKPFPLWKHPTRLLAGIREVAAGLPPTDQVLLTMTAELCDCFATKREGVRAVVDATTAAFGEQCVVVWGIDGQFHRPGAILADPLRAAAVNWLALATAVARSWCDGLGLLIDIGSTTTDIIPWYNGRIIAEGKTDTQRLQSGELVYAGVRRTPVAAIATSLPHKARDTGLAAELFATTLDVYLTLGQIPEDASDTDTCDGRPATRLAARDRLARMIGADSESFSAADALELARAAHEALAARLSSAARRVLGRSSSGVGRVVLSGSGEFLARQVASSLVDGDQPILSLADVWGQGASTVACARALLELAKTPGSGP